MRLQGLGLLGVALVAAAVSSSPVTEAIGGLVIFGAGQGTATAVDGSYVCPNSPFEVRAVFLPGDRGILGFNWIGPSGSCVLFSGGTIAGGSVAVQPTSTPPVEYIPACTGSESTGLDCGFIAIGPYSGPGSSVWIQNTKSTERFYGQFIAT